MPEIIDNIKVGEFIKTLLKKEAMTQEDLAQKLMISKSAVSQNLNGKSSFDIQNLMAIAKLFKMSLDDLLNCHVQEEKDEYVSEYMRFASKGLEELKKHNPNHLQIQEPDIYGKVLVDYLIEQDLRDIFIYLSENNVPFVKDFYHRSKEIYIKIIIYMLRNEIPDVLKYMKKFSELNHNFDLTLSYNGLEVWTLLNDTKYESLMKDMMHMSIDQEVTFIGVKRKKAVKAITKDIWIQSIGTYKLDIVLNVYIKGYASREDLYTFTSSMLLFEYIEGVQTFLNHFFKEEITPHQRQYYNFQKTILLVIKHGNLSLFKQFIDMRIFESLTNVIISAIQNHNKPFYEYILKYNDAKIFDKIDYDKVGYAAVKQSSISLLEIIKDSLDQTSLNYLLSETNQNDVDMLYYLIKKGAKFDFKYYNSNTMSNTNQIITYLLEKEVK